MTRLCLPLRGLSADEVEQKVKESTFFDLIELWVSTFEGVSVAWCEQMLNSSTTPLLIVPRSPAGAHSFLSSDEQWEVITLCAATHTLFDLDIRENESELKRMLKEGVSSDSLIVSSHNYSETPSLENLLNIERQMEEFSPTMSKFAAFCNSPRDAVTLMELSVRLREKGKKFIVLGMGEEGKIVRLSTSLWGGEILYTPLSDTKASAPGQLRYDEAKMLFSVFQSS